MEIVRAENVSITYDGIKDAVSDVSFSVAVSGWDIFKSDVAWVVSSDGHGDWLRDFPDGFVELDEDADLAVHVAIDAEGLAFFELDDLEAAEIELLTHGNGGIGEEVGGELTGFFDGGWFLFHEDVEDAFNEGVELIGSGDEVGFAVDFDDRGFAALIADAEGS